MVQYNPYALKPFPVFFRVFRGENKGWNDLHYLLSNPSKCVIDYCKYKSIIFQG